MKRLLRIAAALVAIMTLCLVDAFVIEPSWPKLVRHELTLDGLASPLKVALLADLHTKSIGRRERRVLEMLASEKPDIVLIAGDLAHGNGRPADVTPFLERLDAPLGVIVVPGNWDTWRGGRDAGLPVYAAAGAIVLRDETATPREDLVVAGLDDTLTGSPDPAGVLAHLPDGKARIVLMHEPGLFDSFAGKAPLALAGHTHGGQGRLPFWGPITLPPGSGDYVDGWYEKNGSRLYVTRGLGTSVIAARFFCRPEVTILELQPAAPNR